MRMSLARSQYQDWKKAQTDPYAPSGDCQKCKNGTMSVDKSDRNKYKCSSCDNVQEYLIGKPSKNIQSVRDSVKTIRNARLKNEKN